MRRSGAMFLLAMTAALSLAAASGPAREYRAELSPLGWLFTYNDIMMTGDKSALLASVYYSTDNGRRVAELVTAQDAAAGRAIQRARELIDRKTAQQIGRMLGDIGNDDMLNATVQVTGNHAVVDPGGGLSTTPMRLDRGMWKIDFDVAAANRLRNGNLDVLVFETSAKIRAADALTRALDAGEVKNLEDALVAIRRAEAR